MESVLARGLNRRRALVAWAVAALLVALSGADVLHVPVFAAGFGYLVYSATVGPTPAYTLRAALLRCVASVAVSAAFLLPIALALAVAHAGTSDCAVWYCEEGEPAEPVVVTLGLAAAAALYVASCFVQRRVWKRDRAIWLTIAVVQLAYPLVVPLIPSVTS